MRRSSVALVGWTLWICSRWHRLTIPRGVDDIPVFVAYLFQRLEESDSFFVAELAQVFVLIVWVHCPL
jgi:hypothetical protein